MQTNGESTKEQPEEKFFTKPLLIIFVTIFIDLLGFGIVIPLLPFYAQEFKASPMEIGFLISSYSWMQFIFSPILGGLSDRYGRRPVLFVSILGSGIGYMMIGLAGALWMVYAGRILGGITGANLSTAQAYIADVTTRKNRAKGMGLFGMAFGLGFIFGPALAGILSKFGHEVPFYVAAALSFLNAASLFFILPESLKAGEAAPVRKSRLAELFKSLADPRFSSLALIYFLLVMAFTIMTTAFPLYTNFSFGYDAEKTGYILAYVGLVAAVMQGGLLGRLVKLFGEPKLIITGCIVLVFSLFAVPYVSAETYGLIGLLIGSGAFAFGNSLASPTLASIVSRGAEEHEQGRILGVLQSAASLARAIAPTIAGLLMNNAFNQLDSSTLTRTLWTAAAIMAIAAAMATYHFSASHKNTALN